MDLFNIKEKKYLDEIEALKKNLREKILEIEELKKEEEDIVREYEARIEDIMNKNGRIEFDRSKLIFSQTSDVLTIPNINVPLNMDTKILII